MIIVIFIIKIRKNKRQRLKKKKGILEKVK